MNTNLFTPVPHYNLPTIVPFTFRDAHTLLEQLEELRKCLIDIQESDIAQSDAISRLVDDTNNAVSSALESVKTLTADYGQLLDDMRHELATKMAIIDEKVSALNAALSRMDSIEAQLKSLNSVYSDLLGSVQLLRSDMETTVKRGEIYVNVRDEGATGDGSTDDTVAFEKALRKAAAADKHSASTILVPCGEYIISRPLTIPSGVIVRGVGDDIIWDGRTSRSCLIYTGRGNFLTLSKDNQLYHMTIHGPGAGTDTVGVAGIKASSVTVERLTISGFGVGVVLTETWYGGLRDCFLHLNGEAGRITYCYNLQFYNVRCACYKDMSQNLGEGWTLSDRTMMTWHGGSVEGFAHYGFKLQRGVTLTLFGAYFETHALDSKNVANALDMIEHTGKGSLVAIGTQMYITNFRSFMEFGPSSDARVVSLGNRFKGGKSGEGTHIYRFSPSGVHTRGTVFGDSLDVVKDSTNNRHYFSFIPETWNVQIPYYADIFEQQHIGLNTAFGQWITLHSYDTPPTGNIIKPGSLCWDNGKKQVAVWDGSAWKHLSGS